MRLRVASISLAEDMAWNWRCYTHILYTHVIYTHEVSSLRWEQALVWVSGRWLTDAHATSRSTPPQRHHWASATHPPLAHTSACANLTRSGVHCKVWASPRQRCSRGHAKHSLAPSAEGSEMGSALYRVLQVGAGLRLPVEVVLRALSAHLTVCTTSVTLTPFSWLSLILKAQAPRGRCKRSRVVGELWQWKSWQRVMQCTAFERTSVHFLVLPVSLFSITEITKYTYFSLI